MNVVTKLGLWRRIIPLMQPPSIASKYQHIGVYQMRHKWLSAFKPLRKRTASTEKSDVILEEPSETESSELVDIKFVLRSTDIPSKIRISSLREKLDIVLDDDFQFNLKSLPVINELFMELYRASGHGVGKMQETFLAYSQIEKLIRRSSNLLMMDEESVPTQIPEYLSIIIAYVLRDETHELSNELLVIITELGIRLQGGNLADILKLLTKNRQKYLSPEFMVLLLERLQLSGGLNLGTFETINKWSLQNFGTKALDSNYLKAYLDYVEKLFINHEPKVHEYLDKERSIFRIQQCTADLIANVELANFKLETLLHLTKFTNDLNQANIHPESEAALRDLLSYLQRTHKNDIGDELIRAADEENELFDGVVTAAWSTGYLEVVIDIMDTVNRSAVLVDSTTLTQGKLFSTLSSRTALSETDIANKVVSVIDKSFSSDNQVNKTKIFQFVLDAAIFHDIVSPNGDYVKAIQHYFHGEHYLKPPVLSYSHRMEKALAKGNYKGAMDIFDDSLEDDVAWAEHMVPPILKTFNNLIVKTCEEVEDVDHVFSIFMRIKQQMVNIQCNVYAINALAKRMLASECVGDAIEMLKRELPNIGKDSAVKISIDKEYEFAYKDLFDTLHDFVIRYDNETTHETNWVLYGEIHKYFKVPFETYLPAMRFFCEHDRPNAALIIFRQVKKLNEMHGHHNNLPPARDMYLYLFQEFGNRLYEEGVIEVHESIKMDVALPKQDIILQNAILNAYSNLQDVGRARDLFLSMAPLKRIEGGINEETIQIMIKTYTYSDIEYVKSFWNNLSSFGIVPNTHIFRQYLIAHVYHGLPQEAIELTEEMDDYNLQIDGNTIAALYNFCMTSSDQDVIEEWAKLNHPELWADVKTTGLLKRSDNYEPETSLLIEGSK